MDLTHKFKNTLLLITNCKKLITVNKTTPRSSMSLASNPEKNQLTWRK